MVWLPIRTLQPAGQGARGRVGVLLEARHTARDPGRIAQRLPQGPDRNRNEHLMLHGNRAYPDAGRPVSASAPGSGTSCSWPRTSARRPHGSSQYRGCTSVDGASPGSRRAAPRHRAAAASGPRPSGSGSSGGPVRARPQRRGSRPAVRRGRSPSRAGPARRSVAAVRARRETGAAAADAVRRGARPAARRVASTVQNVRGRGPAAPRAPPAGRPGPGPGDQPVELLRVQLRARGDAGVGQVGDHHVVRRRAARPQPVEGVRRHAVHPRVAVARARSARRGRVRAGQPDDAGVELDDA